jgi:Fic family protein
MKERYQEITDKTEKLKGYLGAKKLQALAQDYSERFEMSWVYHDSALEGVVYTPPELMAALRPGAVAAEASLLPIVLEIRNHKACVDFLKEDAKTGAKKSVVTMTQVRRIHDLLSGNTPEAQAARAAAERRERSEKELQKEKDRAGLRRDMPLHRTYFHEISQPSKILPALEKILEFTTSAEWREFHPIQQASWMQHKFIQIFPFAEHSGKVGRMLSNLLLLRHGLLPVVIHAIDRQRYYEAFRGPEGVFRVLLMDALQNSVDNGLKFFSESARKYKVV